MSIIRKRVISTLVVLLMLATAAVAAQTVYITNSGSKYHASGCGYLSKSSIPITLEDAKAQGYSPCSVCKPPR